MSACKVLKALLLSVVEGDAPLTNVPWDIADALSLDPVDEGGRLEVALCYLRVCVLDELVEISMMAGLGSEPRPATDAELASICADSSWLTVADRDIWPFVALSDAGMNLLRYLMDSR